MAAPEQQHVLTSIAGQYHWRLIGLHTLQDITDVLRREVGIPVVDDGALAHVLATRVGTHGTLVAVLRCIGTFVGTDEDDMVIVVATGLQHLVDIQHVGLVAVVHPAVAALHQHGILVGEGGIGDGCCGAAILLVEILLGILYQPVPRGKGLGRLDTARAAIVALMLHMALPDHPMDVGGVERSRKALAVELHGP